LKSGKSGSHTKGISYTTTVSGAKVKGELQEAVMVVLMVVRHSMT
jgi:hypothetical protein